MLATFMLTPSDGQKHRADDEGSLVRVDRADVVDPDDPQREQAGDAEADGDRDLVLAVAGDVALGRL